jgi:hypothetical protein
MTRTIFGVNLDRASPVPLHDQVAERPLAQDELWTGYQDRIAVAQLAHREAP